MSAYEHGVDKFEGLDIAEQKTKILSETAQNEECSSLPQHPSLDSDMTASYAFVPFYSKKPPGLKVNPVTKRIKVTSIGQGNSLVSADVKVAQLGATVCSILRHVERAIVGVTDRKEEALVESMILQQMPTVSDRIAIQVFQVDIPALLPFYLLKWAQYIILKQNCIVVASTSRQSGYCSTHQSLIDMTWKMPFPHDHKPVSTVYYSEADTILHPINASVLRLVSEASDEFTLISPVRVEKRSSSAPESYKAMETLVLARNPCGRPVCRLSENRTGPVAIQCNTSISHKQRPRSSRLGKGFQAKTLRFRGDPRLRRWRSKKKQSDLPQLLQHKLEVQQAVLKVSKQ